MVVGCAEVHKPIILLVEDNPNDEVLTLRAFKKGNVAHEVVVARDGAAALEHLQAGELPALVLLDLQLPKIDGLEVLRRIRAGERTRHLPVVVLTASALDRDRIAGRVSDANGFVRKPVDIGELAAALRPLDLHGLIVDPSSG
jgi:two-component system response regulator